MFVLNVETIAVLSLLRLILLLVQIIFFFSVIQLYPMKSAISTIRVIKELESKKFIEK